MNRFIDVVRSVHSNLQHLELYCAVFMVTEESLNPGMIFDLLEVCAFLTNLSSVSLGLPFITETNILAETILQTLLQNSNIENLITSFTSTTRKTRMPGVSHPNVNSL
jgi:hypothetical protein